MSADRTWLVMIRDLSQQFQVAGQPGLVVCLVLDVDTGLMLGSGMDAASTNASRAALHTALTQPTEGAPFPPGPPAHVVCPPHALEAVQRGLAELAGADAPEVGIPGDDAEDVLDSMAGHLAGRVLPDMPAQPDDTRHLVGRVREYAARQPWDQLAADIDGLALELTLDGEHSTFVVLVLGSDGEQYGLVMQPGETLADSILSWQPGEDVDLPAGTVMCYLDPRDEAPADALDRSIRYGWPPVADLFPIFVMMTKDGLGELGQQETRQLAVAAEAVVAYLADDDLGPETSGHTTLADGRRGDYTIKPRPAETVEELVRRAVETGDPSGLVRLLGAAMPNPFARADRPSRRRPRREDVVTYRVRVDLKGAKPPCWRRLELASDLMLDELHEILQVTFAWTNSHLHKFAVGGTSVYDHDSEEFLTGFDLHEGGGGKGVAESDVRLDEVLAESGDKLFYLYDFGDDWEHVVKLEAVLPREPGEPRALCTKGRRPTPAEDCGGMYGYTLYTAANDPDDPDFLDARAAIRSAYDGDVGPRDFAPIPFDLDAINGTLRARVKSSD